MWDWDEQGDPYPPEERGQYHNPYASSSVSYHGGYGRHESHSDHSHYHHGHAGHGHDQHHHGHEDVHSYHRHEDAHSYHGQQQSGPLQPNYGAQHESYGDCQNYGQQHAYESEGHEHNSYGHPTSASNMAPAPGTRAYRGHQGYDGGAGYEIQQEHHASPPLLPPSNQGDLFTSDSVVNLTLDEIDALARTHRSRSWLVVLYAPWCRFCQAMEANFERVAHHLEHSNVYVGRFQADGDYKEYAKRYLQLEHFPTILFLPKDSSNIVKYHSENREVDALLAFVQGFE